MKKSLFGNRTWIFICILLVSAVVLYSCTLEYSIYFVNHGTANITLKKVSEEGRTIFVTDVVLPPDGGRYNPKSVYIRKFNSRTPKVLEIVINDESIGVDTTYSCEVINVDAAMCLLTVGYRTGSGIRCACDDISKLF